MSLASSIITAAYRECQIVGITASPTTLETNEALTRLNSLLASVFGFEVGQELTDLSIGGEFDQSNIVREAVPDDARLVVSQSAAASVSLDPRPYDGQRVAVVDAAGTFASYNFTLDANGRKIEAAATLALATNGMSRQWMYRADTANWVRLSDLAAANEMPFPSEFDDYFITSLAMRLNPRHRAERMSDESIAALERQRVQIQARYRKRRRTQDWGSLGLLGQCGRNLGGDLL